MGESADGSSYLVYIDSQSYVYRLGTGLTLIPSGWCGFAGYTIFSADGHYLACDLYDASTGKSAYSLLDTATMQAQVIYQDSSSNDAFYTTWIASDGSEVRFDSNGSALPGAVCPFVCNFHSYQYLGHGVASPKCPAGTPTAGQPKKLGDTNCDGIVRIAIIGDSYISGEGAADGITSTLEPDEPRQPFLPGTDIPTLRDKGKQTPLSNKCHRSNASWAVRVADQLGIASSDRLFAACSGAITDNVIYNGTGQWPRSAPGVIGAKPQSNELKSFDAVAPVDLILVSIGGNDVSFADVITRCLLYSCLQFPFNGWKGDAQREARSIGDRVRDTLIDLESSAPHAQVWLAGYPDPTAVEQCGETGWGTSLGSIDSAEQQWLKDNFIAPLNTSLAGAAAAANAGYVDFQDAFQGHQLCSGKDKAYANGLKAGDDVPVDGLGPLAAGSFHPNAMGHRHLAQVFWNSAALSTNFGASSSYVQSTISVQPLPPPPAIQVSDPPVGTSGGLQASPGATLRLNGANAPPESTGVIVFNSLPTSLGTFTADARGTWSALVKVPYTAGPGLHLLTALSDSDGTEVASILVPVETGATCPAAPAAPDVDGDGLPDYCDPDVTDGPLADFDRDGVRNNLDNCPALANPAQTDTNANGIGDTCDPTLGNDLAEAVRPFTQPTVPASPGVPSAHASRDSGSVTVSFARPAGTGGASITSYVVAASPGGKSITVASSRTQATIGSLGTGRFTFRVRAVNAVGPGAWSPPSNSVTLAAPVSTGRAGYWMLDADGHVYAFGRAQNLGSSARPSAAFAAQRSGKGYWIVDAFGNVSHFGAAAGHGGRPPLGAGERVSTISATPSGNGYWLFTNRGRAFSYGDAHFYGDMSAVVLNGPIVASVSTPTGHGYYMVGSDGGVFSFGDAHFHGSTGAMHLNKPIVGISPTPDNRGYWLVASDGGVFAFTAPFRGSMGATSFEPAGERTCRVRQRVPHGR